MPQVMRGVGSGTVWLLGVIWFADHAITGHGAARIASALVLAVMAILAALALWQRAHPGPERRRTRERDNNA